MGREGECGSSCPRAASGPLGGRVGYVVPAVVTTPHTWQQKQQTYVLR